MLVAASIRMYVIRWRRFFFDFAFLLWHVYKNINVCARACIDDVACRSVGRSDGCLACVLLIVCVRTLFRACAQNRDGRSNAKEKGASECVCVCVWSIVAFHMRQTNASKYARIRFIQLICVMVCVEKWNINWKYVQIVNAYAKRGQRRIYAAAAATTSTHVFVFIYKRATTTMESALIIWYSMWRLSRSPHTSIKSNRIPNRARRRWQRP